MEEALQAGIDGEDQFLARLAVVARELAYHPAIGVDLDLAVARLAAQQLVVLPLDPVFADAKPGELEQRVAGQLLFRHRGHVAQHMR